jgi:hypothetical protein
MIDLVNKQGHPFGWPLPFSPPWEGLGWVVAFKLFRLIQFKHNRFI